MPRTTSQDQVGGTQVAEVIYYCRGTLILTETGEVPVETLRPGDRVITRSGTPQPVLWLGTLSFGSAHVTHGGLLPQAARPIRIAAGAFGPGTPHTDLRVSPNHALYHDGVLIPAFCLVNGATIRPEPVLPAHHLVLANGMPSESWIDIGNRRFFDDAPVTACRTGPVGGASEAGDGASWRWTDGAAALPAGTRNVMATIAHAGTYLAPPGTAAADRREMSGNL